MVNFKKILIEHKSLKRGIKTFADELNSKTLWAAPLMDDFTYFEQGNTSLIEDSHLEDNYVQVQPLKILEEVAPTEKEETLDSMKEFVEKESVTLGKISFPGGEVKKQKKTTEEVNLKHISTSWDVFKSRLSCCKICEDKVCSQGVFNPYLDGEIDPPLDILFVSDYPKDFPTNLDDFSKKIFYGEKELMVNRMIGAMEINSSKFKISSAMKCSPSKNTFTGEVSEACLDHLREEIHFLKPRVVVAFGAMVTNLLLGRREKLSKIHGEFFPQKEVVDGSEFSYQVVPIFHPDFLMINANMKRTTWEDLKKIISFLKE